MPHHYDSVFVELSIEEKVEFEETFEDRVITHLTDKKIAPSRIEEKTVISMKNT